MTQDMIDTTPFARKFRLRRQHDGFCYQLTAEVPVVSLPAAVLKRLEAAGSGPFGQEDLIPFGEPQCLNSYGVLQWDAEGYCTGGAGAYALRPTVPVAEVVEALRERALRRETEAELARQKAEELAKKEREAKAKREAKAREEKERWERQAPDDPNYRLKKLEEGRLQTIEDRIAALEKPD